MGASLLKYILTSWQTVKKGTKPSKRRPSAYMKYGRVAFAQEGKSFAEQKILGLGDAVHSLSCPIPGRGSPDSVLLLLPVWDFIDSMTPMEVPFFHGCFFTYGQRLRL